VIALDRESHITNAVSAQPWRLLPRGGPLFIWPRRVPFVVRLRPENEASVHLQVQAGLRVVGLRERDRRLNDAWRNVLFPERRSKVLG
jgi:hypothetical protein